MKIKNIKIDYEAPALIEIQLLDETARGWSEPEPFFVPQQPDSLNDDDRFKREIDDALF